MNRVKTYSVEDFRPMSWFIEPSQTHFLKQVLVNDYDRTPISPGNYAILKKVIDRGWYDERQQPILNEILTKYKDHVWGTHV